MTGGNRGRNGSGREQRAADPQARVNEGQVHLVARDTADRPTSATGAVSHRPKAMGSGKGGTRTTVAFRESSAGDETTRMRHVLDAPVVTSEGRDPESSNRDPLVGRDEGGVRHLAVGTIRPVRIGTALPRRGGFGRTGAEKRPIDGSGQPPPVVARVEDHPTKEGTKQALVHGRLRREEHPPNASTKSNSGRTRRTGARLPPTSRFSGASGPPFR